MRLKYLIKSEIGQTVTEYALVTPLLILLFLGVFDLGRAFFNYNTLAEAAREGARYATVHGATSQMPVGPGSPTFTAPDRDTAVEAVVQRFSFDMNSAQLTVLATWPNGDNWPGSEVQIEVRYTYIPFTTMIFGGLPLPLRSASSGIIVY